MAASLHFAVDLDDLRHLYAVEVPPFWFIAALKLRHRLGGTRSLNEECDRLMRKREP